MKQFAKTLSLLGACLFAVACNNAVTQQEKDAADTQALSAIKSGNQNTSSAAALGTAGVGISAAVSGGVSSGDSVSGVDLSEGLPKPGSDLRKNLRLTPRASSLVKRTLHGKARSDADTVTLSGCIEPDSNGDAVYYANGDSGCTAATFLEVDYVNGDQVQISFTDDTTFDWKVTKGNYTGTELSFSVTAGTSDTDFKMTIAGALDYTSGGTAQIADKFQMNYDVSVDDSSSKISETFTGYAEDDIALKKVTYDDSLVLTIGSAANSFSFSIQWDGNATVANLQNSAGFPASTTGLVEYKNLKITATVSINGASNTVNSTNTASGEVDYEGHKIGTVGTDSKGNVVVKWNDNTTTDLDVSEFDANLS